MIELRVLVFVVRRAFGLDQRILSLCGGFLIVIIRFKKRAS